MSRRQTLKGVFNCAQCECNKERRDLVERATVQGTGDAAPFGGNVVQIQSLGIDCVGGHQRSVPSSCSEQRRQRAASLCRATRLESTNLLSKQHAPAVQEIELWSRLLSFLAGWSVETAFEEDGEIVEEILKNCYVNNIMTIGDSTEEAVGKLKYAKKRLADASIELRDLVSNNHEQNVGGHSLNK
ncbi:unnamed protein product, partial [Mesorhabditis belari]|uniref:Uncharacterized protein n=1 Tax=Mesorhabditis belari TaxID=2138241 RepID=A0AAF3EYW8_9BILA